MKKSMLIDTTKCMGCRSCQVACKQWNQLPAEGTSFDGSYENPRHFSPLTWTKVVFKEHETETGVKWLFAKQGCMHCTDAACEKVCPTGAIHFTELGTVAINYNKCIGCNYCAANCTFQVLSFSRTANIAQKCTFCYDRVVNGLAPACATACPTGAIKFGDRRELIGIAEDRLAKLQRNGHPNANIYGLEELSGTAVFYLLDETPEHYGLPDRPSVSFSAYFWNVIFKPLRVLVVAAVAFGLWANRSESNEIQKGNK